MDTIRDDICWLLIKASFASAYATGFVIVGIGTVLFLVCVAQDKAPANRIRPWTRFCTGLFAIAFCCALLWPVVLIGVAIATVSGLWELIGELRQDD